MERASPVLYHYTTAWAALRIVTSNQFELAIGAASPSERRFAPPGYPYFLSLTRTRTGDYHRWAGNGAVMLNLDGLWFDGRYPVKPVDYWERAWLHPGSERTRESEDRVFAREPTIPATALRQVHILLKEQDEYRSPQVRQLMIACKQRQLPVFLYDDERAWRLQDTQRSIRPDSERAQAVLRGIEPAGYSGRAHNYLADWIELLHKKATKELSARAEKLRYNLRYYARPDDDANLELEIGNARKPGAGASRRSAIEILTYMKNHGMRSTREFKNMIANKWDKISDQERAAQEPATESTKPPRTVATKQAMATRSLYRNEGTIERIWGMRRPRSLKALQTALDMLWDHYSQALNSRRRKPQMSFGPGVKYGGRSISYTQDVEGGQRIVLAPGERNLYVLVHELAHALGAIEHGVRFAQIYHDMLQHDTFRELMSSPAGQEFLEYLRVEHPRRVRRIYR
jgi:predicted metal-dependent hydrolase